MVKDYNDQEMDLGKMEEYVELCCHKCGNTIGFSIEDTSLNQSLCESCFDEVFDTE